MDDCGHALLQEGTATSGQDLGQEADLLVVLQQGGIEIQGLEVEAETGATEIVSLHRQDGAREVEVLPVEEAAEIDTMIVMMTGDMTADEAAERMIDIHPREVETGTDSETEMTTDAQTTGRLPTELQIAKL